MLSSLNFTFNVRLNIDDAQRKVYHETSKTQILEYVNLLSFGTHKVLIIISKDILLWSKKRR